MNKDERTEAARFANIIIARFRKCCHEVVKHNQKSQAIQIIVNRPRILIAQN